MNRALKSFLVATLLAISSAVAQAEDKTSEVRFVVVREWNGKPIRNASVVLHPVDNKGRQSNKGAQLKTNPDGKTEYPGVPYGKIRVQVIATGFQTFGEDYVIDQPSQEFT